MYLDLYVCELNIHLLYKWPIITKTTTTTSERATQQAKREAAKLV